MATYSVLRQLKLSRNVAPLYAKTSMLLPAVPATSNTLMKERDLHTSRQCQVDHRKERAVVKHLYYRNHEKSLGHAQTPLVDLPDYTYQDGRPTEMTISFKERQEQNYNLAKQVVKMVEEIKFAQYQLKAQEEAKVKFEEERRKSQLKQKGKVSES